VNFGEHIGLLISAYPQCETHTAESIVWQAIIAVYNEHPWPFCVKEGRIVTEGSYATGTLQVTNGLTAVTLSDGVWDPTWTLRRIDIAGRSETYDMATILAGSGTLVQPWQGEDNAAATYTMFRDVYSLPTDCNMGREHYILHPASGRCVRHVDYGVFLERKARGQAQTYANGTGIYWCTRVGMTAAGAAQLQFDPPPSTVETFPIIYYATPPKPTAYTSLITPLFPPQYEDLIWRKARWLYAEERRKWRERDQFRAIYYDRFFDAKATFDGGAEIDRVLRGAHPNVYTDWRDNIASAIVRGTFSA
jgi:hypothetical protein